MERNIPTHAAKAVIKNQNGEILFLRRHPGRGVVSNWDLPGGLVESGEADVDALMREIHEELGITAKVGPKIGDWAFFRPLDEMTVQVTNYETEISVGELTLSDEHSEFQWVAQDKVQQLAVKDPSIFSALK